MQICGSVWHSMYDQYSTVLQTLSSLSAKERHRNSFLPVKLYNSFSILFITFLGIFHFNLTQDFKQLNFTYSSQSLYFLSLLILSECHFPRIMILIYIHPVRTQQSFLCENMSCQQVQPSSSSLMLNFLQLLRKISIRMLTHQVVNKVNIISEKHLHFGIVGMLAHQQLFTVPK